jgi:hypothetical protein
MAAILIDLHSNHRATGVRFAPSVRRGYGVSLARFVPLSDARIVHGYRIVAWARKTSLVLSDNAHGASSAALRLWIATRGGTLSGQVEGYDRTIAP